MPAAISTTSTVKVANSFISDGFSSEEFLDKFGHQCSGGTPLRPKPADCHLAISISSISPCPSRDCIDTLGTHPAGCHSSSLVLPAWSPTAGCPLFSRT